MKKVLFLVSTFFIPSAFAADFSPESSLCIQVLTPAVNTRGVCEVFPTPCDVPDGWKIVSSCDLVKPPKFGLTMDEIQKRRWQQQWEQVEEAAQEQLESEAEQQTGTEPRFVGRSYYTKRKGDANRRLSENQGTSFFDLRGSTMPNFGNNQTYERFRTLNAERQPGLSDGITKLQELQERWDERGYQRPQWETSTIMDRESLLSPADSFFNRRPVKAVPTGERVWKSLEHLTKPKLAKRKNAREGVQLRKVYRDSSLGNLSGEALLEERTR
ncbi:hypothetical protein K9L63_02840 [Candidatus Gracilibacteria bacterium]|nr:hypothetical protein [Candidatus Gracilibacteria bacterium]